MMIGLSMMHPYNLPSLLWCSIFLFLFVKNGVSTKWEHGDGERDPLDTNVFEVTDLWNSDHGFWKKSRMFNRFEDQKTPEHGDSSILINHNLLDDRIDNLSFPSEEGTNNNDVSQIQQDSSEKGVYDEASQRELRDDQSDSVNNRGSVLISNRFVGRSTGTEMNKYGFETEVVKIEQAVTFGLTKTGGKNTNDQGNAESLSKILLSKITGQISSEEQLDDSRIEIGRASKPRRKAVSRVEPDLDPKTIFKCRCEYPDEGIYIKMNKSGNSNGSGKFRRILSTGKNRSFFRRPTLSRKKIFYRNTWDVDQYAVLNGTSILPPWHAACTDVVFICSGQSMNNCSLWEYHCTTDDFPMHRHKSSTAKLNNGKRNLQSSIHSKHSERTTSQESISAKSSRRKLGTCKAIVLPNDNQFCLSNKTTRSSDTISHQKVPTEKHDSTPKDSINFSPRNPDLSKNSDSVATSPSQRPPTRMPSKRKRPISSQTPHNFKPRPQKTKAPNRNVISTLPPTKQPTRRVSKDDPLQSTVAINAKSPTSQRDRDATPQLLDTQNESMTSGSETLTPTKLPTPRLHSTDIAEDSSKDSNVPFSQQSLPPTKVPTPRPSPESSSFSDTAVLTTNTAKEVTHFPTVDENVSTSPSTRPQSLPATVPSERCDGYDLKACLVSGNPKNRVSSVEDCSSRSNECGASSRNIMVSLLTTGFDPLNQETFLIYNVSQSETASVDRVTFSWTGDCCIRDASFSGSKVLYGLDTKTCSYGVMFGDILSGSHDLYKIVFAGNIPIQGSSMEVKVSISDTVCKFAVPGPDCSICASDLEHNNETIPAFIMSDSPTIDLSPSITPQDTLESSKDMPFQIQPIEIPIPTDALRSSMSVVPSTFPSRIIVSSTSPQVLSSDGVASALVAESLLQIKGYVLEDLNNDNTGDEPIIGVTVRLLDANKTLLNETTTDSKGEFAFINLRSGEYILNQMTSINFIGVNDSDGGDMMLVALDNEDSLANIFVDTRRPLVPISVRSGTSSLPSLFPSVAPSGSATPSVYPSAERIVPHGENITCKKIVDEPLRRIEGIVLEDMDGDKVGDEPINGVKILLMDSNRVILNETTTDRNGEFSFLKVIPGLYSLSEIQPIGFESVIDNNGGDLGSVDVNVTLGDSSSNIFVISRPEEAFNGNVSNGYTRRSLLSTKNEFHGKTRRRSTELSTESSDSESLNLLSRSDSTSCGDNEIIVFENFEDYNDDQDLIDAGWSDAYLDVSQRGQIFTKFLGRYGQFPAERNKKPSRVYSVPSYAEYLIVEFDFYEIDSWSNPDSLFAYIEDDRLDLGVYFSASVDEGFRNQKSVNHIQWVLDSYPTYKNSSTSNLGFNSSVSDQIHHIMAHVPSEIFRSTGSIKLQFETITNGFISEKSAGFDNVKITAFYNCTKCEETYYFAPESFTEYVLGDISNLQNGWKSLTTAPIEGYASSDSRPINAWKVFPVPRDPKMISISFNISHSSSWEEAKDIFFVTIDGEKVFFQESASSLKANGSSVVINEFVEKRTVKWLIETAEETNTDGNFLDSILTFRIPQTLFADGFIIVSIKSSLDSAEVPRLHFNAVQLIADYDCGNCRANRDCVFCISEEIISADDFEGSEPLQGWHNGVSDINSSLMHYLGRFSKQTPLSPFKLVDVPIDASNILINVDFYEMDAWKKSTRNLADCGLTSDCVFIYVNSQKIPIGSFGVDFDEGSYDGTLNGVYWRVDSVGLPGNHGYEKELGQKHKITINIPKATELYQDGQVKMEFETLVSSDTASAGWDNVLITAKYNCHDVEVHACPHCIILDFETAGNGSSLIEGHLVGYEWYDEYGIILRAVSDSGDSKSLQILNSANPGKKSSLGTPNEDCPSSGPGVGFQGSQGMRFSNCIEQGNVLVLGESAATDGSFVFHFENPLKLEHVTLLDITVDGNSMIVTQKGDKRSVISVPALGRNSLQKVKIDLFDVIQLEISHIDSGALVDIGVCFQCDQPVGCLPIEKKFDERCSQGQFSDSGYNPFEIIESNTEEVTFKIAHKQSFESLRYIEMWYMNPNVNQSKHFCWEYSSSTGLEGNSYYENTPGLDHFTAKCVDGWATVSITGGDKGTAFQRKMDVVEPSCQRNTVLFDDDVLQYNGLKRCYWEFQLPCNCNRTYGL